MKIWISKNSEVPIRKEIASQIKVAIASGDLRSGEKLPSTRELARRLGIHSNTVSAAYRELVANGNVALRNGSGIYVRDKGEELLDVLLEGFFRDAADAGCSKDAVLDKISTLGRQAKPKDLHY